MKHPTPPQINHFQDWLEATTAGTSTPAPTSPGSNLPTLCHAASHVRELARHETSTHRAAMPGWEDIMHAYGTVDTPSIISTSVRNPVAASRGRTSPSPRIHRFDPRSWGTSRVFTVAINVMLAVVLVVAVGSGIWRATGSWLPGGSDPESIPFGGAGPSDATPTPYPTMTDDQTPETLQTFEPAPLPTAKDCTVKPLSVNQVLERFGGRSGYDPEPGVDLGTPASLVQDWIDAGSPIETDQIPDKNVIDDIAKSQRQWLACHLAGDPFRYWALESDSMIAQSILGVYGPQVSVDTLRADLTALASGSTDTPFQPMTVAQDAFLPLIVTSGWDALYPEPNQGKVSIPIYWTNLDGSLSFIPAYQSIGDGIPSSLNGLPNTAIFIFDFTLRYWVLDDMSNQSGG